MKLGTFLRPRGEEAILQTETSRPLHLLLHLLPLEQTPIAASPKTS